MNDTTRLECLRAGYLQTGSMYADLLDVALSREELVLGQVSCLGKLAGAVPVDWHNENTPLHYLLKPKKGMNKRAVSELQKFLKANPEGCVLSVSMTAFRSAVAVFPGADAVEQVWNRMTNLLRKDGSLS